LYHQGHVVKEHDGVSQFAASLPLSRVAIKEIRKESVLKQPLHELLVILPWVTPGTDGDVMANRYGASYTNTNADAVVPHQGVLTHGLMRM